MRILQHLASIFGSFGKYQSVNEKRTVTDRNPHKRTRFEVAKDFYIDAINIESARAQYDKIMHHKAMRLSKSLTKEINYGVK